MDPSEFNMLLKHVKQLFGTVKFARNIIKLFQTANWLRRALEVCQRRMYEVTSNLTLAENAAEREDAPFKVVQLCHNLRLACRVSLSDVDEWLRECISDSWTDTFASVDTRKVEYRRQRLDISRSNLLQAKIKFQNEEVGDIVSLGRSAEPIQEQETVANAHRYDFLIY
jgi:hypothetical protein